jgi:hypothetical protein
MVIHFQLHRGKKNQIPFNSTFLNPEGYFFQILPADTIQMKKKILSLLLKGSCKSNVDLGVRGHRGRKREGSFAH